MIFKDPQYMIEQHRVFPGVVPECPESELMFNLQDLINQNYRYERNVNFYLTQLHTTYYYLNSRCRYYIGKSLNELIEERLFIESCKFLKYTMMSVKSISYELGFSDPSNFNRFFKRHAEMTALEFRAAVRKSALECI